MTRSFMSLYYNSVRGKSAPELLPQDFWTLSYDKRTDTEPTEEEKIEIEGKIKALEQKAKERALKRLKKNG
jgi:hypothetical protein